MGFMEVYGADFPLSDKPIFWPSENYGVIGFIGVFRLKAFLLIVILTW